MITLKQWLGFSTSATTILLLIRAACAADPAPQPLTLVKDGQPTSVIVVPAAPNEAAAFGAKELQWHLKKITGADVPIVNDRQKVDADKVQILVGESRATRALGLSVKGYKSQEYSLQSKGNAIVLMGLDVLQYPSEASSKPTVWPSGRFGSAWDGWAAAGIKDHGFNDESGTMECFVYVAKDTNETTTGWMMLRVGDEQNGQMVHSIGSPKRYLAYQTFVNGQKNEILCKEEWFSRKPGWHHVMATWDAAANKTELFLDGKSVGTAPYAKTACNKAPFFSVRGDGNNTPSALGPIDEVRVSRVVRKPVVPTKAYETDDDTLILLHFDDPTYIARDDSEFPRISPKEPQSDGKDATLYAVYDFLEKSCGVRWYAPSEEGMVCPKTNTFAVTVKDLRRTPALEMRSSSVPVNGWGWVAGNCSSEDLKVHGRRLKIGGKNLFIQHSFEGFPDMYWEKNPACPEVFVEKRPEYFELQADGSRLPRQLCWSSTGLVAQVIADARKYFSGGGGPHRGHAGDDYYVLAPRDDQSDRCQCPDCKKAVAAGGPETTDFVSGNASELIYPFLNKVQEAVTETHPGKHIACFNYYDYSIYPKTVKVNTNLYIGQALGAGWVFPEWPMKVYTQWRDNMPRGHVLCLWSYECFPWETGDVQGFKVFPDWNSHLIARDTKMFVDDGVRGIFQCGLTPYIDGYLTVKLMDDPTINIDQELEYFFTGFYGTAAEPMKQMYLYLEQIYTNTANYTPEERANLPATVGYTPEEKSWYWLGRPERMEKLGTFLKEAKAKAGTDMAKKRVAAYERDIWAYMQEGYKTYTAKQPGGKHPYPFTPNAGKFAAQKRDPMPGAPSFLTSAFFRDSANGLGVLDTGFNDQQGTMEGWVWCGKAGTNYCQGPGPLFEILNLRPVSGHRVRVEADVKKGVFIPIYETFTGGKTNQITGKPMKPESWHHISATWDGKAAAMNLYVDAAPSGKAAYRTTDCALGRFDIGVGTGAFGPIDEVRLSKVVRKPTPQQAPYKTNADTLLLLHFDEAPGTMITDSSKAAP